MNIAQLRQGYARSLPGWMLALSAGCHGAGTTNQGGLDGPVHHGGSLIYATDREPLCLDPHVVGDMPQVFVAQQFLDSLVAMDTQGHIHPWLARSWSLSPDGLSYTFQLRHDVHFTDGSRFDARALKANLEQIVDPNTQSSTAGGYLRQYVGTEVVDDFTAIVHLNSPYAAFLEVMAQGFLGMESPAAMARGREVNCASPVGSGPFKVLRWDRQNQVLLERNPDYAWSPPYARHQGPAYLQQIRWKFIPEPSIRFASLEAGEVGAIDVLPPEDEAAAIANPDLKVLEADLPGNPTNGTLNITRAPFNDIRVREALVRSADIEGALYSVYFQRYHRAGGPLSPSTPFYSADFEHAQDYDPARAARLLDEAGWTQRDAAGYRLRQGHRLTVQVLLRSASQPAELTLWEQVQASTKKAGFELKMDVRSESSAMLKQSNWDYDIRVGYWNTNTADVLRIVFGSQFIGPVGGKGGFHQNSAGFQNRAFDAIVQQALNTQDEARRRQFYYQAQHLVSQQYLQLTTYPQSTRLAVYKTVHGVAIEPSLRVTSLYDAWVDP